MSAASGRRADRAEQSRNAILRNRSFRRMWAAIGVSSFGDWLGLLAMMGLAQQLTKSGPISGQAAAISGVLIVRLLPDLILAPIAGSIADKFDRRKTVIIGEIVAALLYVMIALTFDIRTMYVGQFTIEAIGLITMASKNTLWMSTVKREKIGAGQQLLMFTIYGSFPLASGLYAILSWFHSFFVKAADAPQLAEQKFVVLAALFVDAGTYLASAAIVWTSRSMLPAHAAGERQQKESIVKLIGEGIAFVFSNSTVRALYIGVLGAFAAAGITAGVALTYVNSLQAGFAGYGILLGTAFTGLALGMVAGPRLLPAVARRRIFGMSIAIAGCFLMGMGLSRDFVLGVGLGFGVGFFAGMAWILGYTMIGQEVDEHIRGRTFSFVVSSARIMLMVTLAIGPVLSGLLGSHEATFGGVTFAFSGPGLTLLIAGLVALLIGGYSGRSTTHRRLGLRWLLDRLAPHGEVFADASQLGLFIVVESANRTRAAEQAKHLAARLTADGLPVVLTGEPTDSGVGHRIAELMDRVATGAPSATDVLPSTAVFLAAADRAEHVDKVVRPALDAGKVVVCSGYVDTTVAFFGSHSEVDSEEILRLSEWGNEGLAPDLTIILDEPYAGDDPIELVREAFLARRDATVRGYAVVPPATTAGLEPDVLRHANAAVVTRRDHIQPV
ncbi:bifunctional MFS transporter/dTMP kinase [Cumulibacter manganitolerans]|uniref:bifunctional MFS transporter/dTMP kinase n=1 Tax=Cumulibacter manganitolerans TaxID=1884992 RepID=UPI0018860223|nr:dTMP kinase [Cumulibacter manganitolerans]